MKSLVLSIVFVIVAFISADSQAATRGRPAASNPFGESETALTGSIGAVDGDFVFGPGFQMEWPVRIDSSRFAFGWQTGFYYTSTSETVRGAKASASEWGIPILATGKYLFETSTDFLKPYFAISTGLGIDRSSGDDVSAGVVTRDHSTNIHFMILFRPGTTFGVEHRWFAELPMGVLFTDFAILPTIGYRF
jgi:hypothetical protein